MWWGVTCWCELCGLSIFTQQKILLQQRWQRKDVVLAQEALASISDEITTCAGLSGMVGTLLRKLWLAGLKIIKADVLRDMRIAPEWMRSICVRMQASCWFCAGLAMRSG